MGITPNVQRKHDRKRNCCGGEVERDWGAEELRNKESGFNGGLIHVTHKPYRDHQSAKAQREAERKGEGTIKNLKSSIHPPWSN